MSYGCLIILRKCENKHELFDNLKYIAQSNNCAIWLHSRCNLIQENSVKIMSSDCFFEVCDTFDSDDASMLLGYDGCTINGKQPTYPLYHRLTVIQEIATACTSYAERIELFLGEDSPYLSDYVNYVLETNSIAETLYKEYLSNEDTPFIPCVHISTKGTVSKTAIPPFS